MAESKRLIVGGVKTYKINLDDPPGTRWNAVIDDYGHKFKPILKDMKKDMADVLGKMKAYLLQKAVSTVMKGAAGLGMVYYAQELKGIAARANIDLGLGILLQLVYEASSCCTSIVVEGEDGTPYHIRTMDWGMDFLNSLTIQVHFYKGGKFRYSATTWAGYVGVLTGMRPGKCSVSVNFRDTGGSFWTNVKKAVTSRWPVGFLVREVLDDAKSFDQAVSWLATSGLIAPCYFTVAGPKKGQAVLLTRRQETEGKRWTLEDDGSIVQTNMDFWSDDPNEDILDSLERRALAHSYIPKIKQVNEENLWKMMSVDPIMNSITIYGTFMNPASGILHTRVPVDNSFVPFTDDGSFKHDWIDAREPGKSGTVIEPWVKPVKPTKKKAVSKKKT